jgi:hypothetical protein
MKADKATRGLFKGQQLACLDQTGVNILPAPDARLVRRIGFLGFRDIARVPEAQELFRRKLAVEIF